MQEVLDDDGTLAQELAVLRDRGTPRALAVLHICRGEVERRKTPGSRTRSAGFAAKLLPFLDAGAA